LFRQFLSIVLDAADRLVYGYIIGTTEGTYSLHDIGGMHQHRHSGNVAKRRQTMNVTFEKFGQEFSVEVESLPKESIAYLLQYGWNQSLQDCIAGRAKAVAAEYLEGVKKGKPEQTPAEVKQMIVDDLLGTLGKRFDAIKAGTVGVRVGQPRDELRAIAKEMVAAAVKAKKATVTKEKFAELVQNLLDTKREAVQAEADRRKAAQGTVEVELD
jgi:hypothetical protein